MKYAVVFEQYYIGFVTMAIKTHATLQLFFGFFKNIFPGGGEDFQNLRNFFGCEPIESKKISNQDINFDSYIKITIQNIR